MSWSFSAHARSKDKLKEHARQQLMAYHQVGQQGHALMSQVADKIDALIDLFHVPAGGMIRLETSGHLDGGHGNLKVEVTDNCGTILD